MSSPGRKEPTGSQKNGKLAREYQPAKAVRAAEAASMVTVSQVLPAIETREGRQKAVLAKGVEEDKVEEGEELKDGKVEGEVVEVPAKQESGAEEPGAKAVEQSSLGGEWDVVAENEDWGGRQVRSLSVHRT